MIGSKRYAYKSCSSSSSLTFVVVQGVPIRLEVGPQDLAKKQALSVRRDTGVKEAMPLENIVDTVKSLLQTIQNDMFTKAQKTYVERLKAVTKWEDVVPALDAKNVIVIPWCEEEACEDDIKERSGRA
jgi:prolyl-tRNA synthetase